MTRYRTIVADPPWRYDRGLPRWTSQGVDNSDNLPYQTLSIDEIAALPVGAMAARDSHLYLWATGTHLEHAWGITRAWGFKPSTVLVWCKPPRGFAGRATYSPRTEYVIFARRGSLSAKTQVYRNWFEWPQGVHSQKPDAFLDLVEEVSPGPYVELFARRARFGWDYWGDQSLGTAEVAA